MYRYLNFALFSALLAAAALLGQPRAALAAAHDGVWSVLIITEQGTCDRGYRYEVKVANGHVTYDGGADVNLAGTVSPDGAIKVSIKLGENGASGTGHLSAHSGAGVWRGIGANGSCAGRWEAELR